MSVTCYLMHLFESNIYDFILNLNYFIVNFIGEIFLWNQKALVDFPISRKSSHDYIKYEFYFHNGKSNFVILNLSNFFFSKI